MGVTIISIMLLLYQNLLLYYVLLLQDYSNFKVSDYLHAAKPYAYKTYYPPAWLLRRYSIDTEVYYTL